MVAMRKSVHIISMSWTIDPPEDENERRCREAAIVKAVDENKLVFFSASNKGAKQNAAYPAKVREGSLPQVQPLPLELQMTGLAILTTSTLPSLPAWSRWTMLLCLITKTCWARK